jgi:hypothetical protein
MARTFTLFQSNFTHHYLSTVSQQSNLVSWLVFALAVIGKGADWQQNAGGPLQMACSRAPAAKAMIQ